VAHISEKNDRIFVKLSSQIYPWTRKSLLNFKLCLPHLEWIKTGFALAEICVLQVSK